MNKGANNPIMTVIFPILPIANLNKHENESSRNDGGHDSQSYRLNFNIRHSFIELRNSGAISIPQQCIAVME